MDHHRIKKPAACFKGGGGGGGGGSCPGAPITTTTSTASLRRPRQRRPRARFVQHEAWLISCGSRRLVPPRPFVRTVLVSLSIWQFILAAGNLVAIGSNCGRRRYLLLADRTFYWFLMLKAVPLSMWACQSIAAVLMMTQKQKGEDQLSSVTGAGMMAITLLLLEMMLFSRLVYLVVQTIPDPWNTGQHSPELLFLFMVSLSRMLCFIMWLAFMSGQLNGQRWLETTVVLPGDHLLAEMMTFYPKLSSLVLDIRTFRHYHYAILDDPAAAAVATTGAVVGRKSSKWRKPKEPPPKTTTSTTTMTRTTTSTTTKTTKIQ